MLAYSWSMLISCSEGEHDGSSPPDVGPDSIGQGCRLRSDWMLKGYKDANHNILNKRVGASGVIVVSQAIN